MRASHLPACLPAPAFLSSCLLAAYLLACLYASANTVAATMMCCMLECALSALYLCGCSPGLLWMLMAAATC